MSPKLHTTILDTIFAGCEEPNAASLLCDNGDGTSSFLAERVRQTLRAHAHAALEAAAKVACPECADGNPMLNPTHHAYRPGDDPRVMSRSCKAIAIRALKEAEARRSD